MTISTKTTKGKCQNCGKLFAKRVMKDHLMNCYRSEDGKPSILLFIDCPYRKQFWMHVGIRKDATLDYLDSLLRDNWLECCGHLSQFLVGNIRYVSYSEELEPNDKLMQKTKLESIFGNHNEVSYEYDFGTTTSLSIKVIGTLTMKSDKTNPEILSINETPVFICDGCGEKAKYINSSGSDETYCQKCSDKLDEDEQQMLLPLINSPRTGACGYTGEAVLEKN